MRSTSTPVKHQSSKTPAGVSSRRIGRRGTFVCLIVSLFMAGFSVPLVGTMVAQIRSMIDAEDKLDDGTYRALIDSIRADRRIPAVRQAINTLNDRTNAVPALDRFRQVDPQNGLYGYLDLLVVLRQRGEPSTSAPATQAAAATPNDADLARRLRELASAPPARLYQAHQQQIGESVLTARGIPIRRAVLDGQRLPLMFPELREFHRPVLRELANRLDRLGTGWREAGRPSDALLAHAAGVRLFTGVVEDSPTVDAVLLALERLPIALREMGTDMKAARMNGGDLCETAAEQAAALSACWHAPPAEINFIPRTGDFVVAAGEHHRMMRSMVSAFIAAGTWAMLMAVIVMLLIVVALTRIPADVYLSWRWNGWAAWAAPTIILIPAIVIVTVMATAPISFTWLMGIKSAGSLIFSPFLLLLVLGLAAHLGVEIVPPRERSRMPARAVWIIAAVMVVTLTGLMIWPPVHAEPWQPPAGIQRFRRIAPLMELEAGVIVLVWAVWSWVRRRRAGLPAGIRMRANLAVASRALLICSVIALVSLGINQRNDRQHQEAFARAAADPLADRLGPDWHAYLTPMYAVLNALK